MKKLFFAFAILLAGCQSERVAFQFQPVAPTASAVRPGQAVLPVATAAAAATPVAAVAAASVPVAVRPPAPAHRHRTGRSWVVAPEGPAATLPALAAPVTAPKLPLAQRLVLKHLLRQPATHGQARVAESGLGGIALFFIALVLGLLAGLGALVSLIPGISFFGGVGLAAAGLLVIFLLYSLLSGGKKKKPAAK